MLAKKRSMSDASQGYCAQESPYKNQANLADWQRVSLGYYSARMGRASASKARVEKSDLTDLHWAYSHKQEFAP